MTRIIKYKFDHVSSVKVTVTSCLTKTLKRNVDKQHQIDVKDVNYITHDWLHQKTSWQVFISNWLMVLKRNKLIYFLFQHSTD